MTSDNMMAQPISLNVINVKKENALTMRCKHARRMSQ